MKKFKSIDEMRDHVLGVNEDPEEVSDEQPESEAVGEQTEGDSPEGEGATGQPTPEEVPEEAEGEAEQSQQGHEGEGEGEAEAEAEAAFEPSLTYKSMGEEHKIDDFLADAIKTPEQEQAIKRIYEKAAGLEHLESKNKQLRDQWDELVPAAQEGQALKQEITFYNNLMSQGKYHELLRSINVPDDEILKVASTILQYKDLTQEQQRAYDSNIQSHQRLQELESQTQRLQQQVQSSEISAHESQLSSVLESPSVKQIVDTYDERLGRGSFRTEVINRAAMVESQTGGKTVLTPEQAVNEVLKVIGQVPQTQREQAESGSVANPQTSPTKVVVRGDKPTLPNVQAGAKSPARKVFKSIDEIRKHVESLDDY